MANNQIIPLNAWVPAYVKNTYKQIGKILKKGYVPMVDELKTIIKLSKVASVRDEILLELVIQGMVLRYVHDDNAESGKRNLIAAQSLLCEAVDLVRMERLFIGHPDFREAITRCRIFKWKIIESNNTEIIRSRLILWDDWIKSVKIGMQRAITNAIH